MTRNPISLFGTLNRPSGLERPVNTTVKHDKAQAAGEHDLVKAVSNHMAEDDRSDVNMSEDSDSTISAHDDIIGKLWDGENADTFLDFYQYCNFSRPEYYEELMADVNTVIVGLLFQTFKIPSGPIPPADMALILRWRHRGAIGWEKCSPDMVLRGFELLQDDKTSGFSTYPLWDAIRGSTVSGSGNDQLQKAKAKLLEDLESAKIWEWEESAKPLSPMVVWKTMGQR